MTQKLTLAFICKDEENLLDQMLTSISPHVDEIVCGWTGTNPKTEEILKKHGVIYKDISQQKDCWITIDPALRVKMKQIDPDFDLSKIPDRLPHFSLLRKESFALATNELVMWLDSDDTIVHGKKIKALLTHFDNPKCGALWIPYLYDFDEEGRCTLRLWRERIVKKSYSNWVGAIHESLLAKTEFSTIISDDCFVKHHPLKDRIIDSSFRNLSISLAQYAREVILAAIDAKTVYDLARSYEAVGRFEKALDFFDKYLELSGWNDEMYNALLRQAEIYLKFSQYEVATDKLFRCLKIDPFRKEAYFKLSLVYFKQEQWEHVIYYTNLAFKLRGKATIMPQNPEELTGKPLLPLASALFNIGKFKEASVIAMKAHEFYPENEWLKHALETWPDIAKRFDKRQNLIDACKEIKNKHGEDSKQMKKFAKKLPESFHKDPFFISMIHKYVKKPSYSSDPTIIFYCGSAYEYWDPRSIEKGVGGSEEATIHLAKRLVGLGWKVRIYNNCMFEQDYEGVLYRPFDQYNRETERCDIFVAWRHNQYATFAPKGAKKIVWLHDVQRPEHWDANRTKTIDLIIPLSRWHRTNLKEIPDELFYISRNGIDPSQFIGRHSRDAKRLIYASSPDRGLDTLLEMWPAIRKRDPDAELHVFYGFTKTFDEVHKNNQRMRDWKDYVLGLLKQTNVYYHGRVDHQTLAQEFQKSAIWIYPTNFTEISCITAMKAQAAGTIPICTTVAALNETVQHGFKISGPGGAEDERTQKTFVNVVCRLMVDVKSQEKIRKDMVPWALHYFSWDTVAQEWSVRFKELLNGSSRTT